MRLRRPAIWSPRGRRLQNQRHLGAGPATDPPYTFRVIALQGPYRRFSRHSRSSARPARDCRSFRRRRPNRRLAGPVDPVQHRYDGVGIYFLDKCPSDYRAEATDLGLQRSRSFLRDLQAAVQHRFAKPSRREWRTGPRPVRSVRHRARPVPAQVQLNNMPPLISTLAPVMNALSALARNSTRFAMSSGRP